MATKLLFSTPLLALLSLAQPLFAIQPHEVTISLELSSTNIWPFEMVYASTVISNTTDAPVARTACALGTTKIRNSSGRWEYSHGYGGVEMAPPAPFEIVLPPHGVFEFCNLISTDKQGRSFFSKPGIREMKSFSCFGESEDVQINVLPFPAETESSSQMPETVATLFDKTSFKTLCSEERWLRHKAFDPWALPFMQELEKRDEYADWLQLVRIWHAMNTREKASGDPDPLASLCRELIGKYADRPVPKNRNPIPLALAYVELARLQGTKGKQEEAYKTLADARSKFADNATLLWVLAWEGLYIPQVPKPPSPPIWWEKHSRSHNQ